MTKHTLAAAFWKVFYYGYIVLLILAVVVCYTLIVVHIDDLIDGTGTRDVRIPVCSEDVVIMGEGEYKWGKWSSYICGPALDDLY